MLWPLGKKKKINNYQLEKKRKNNNQHSLLSEPNFEGPISQGR